MDKKLPGIYKNTDYSHVNNNKRVFYSGDVENQKKDDVTASSKEKNISNEYILNTPVIIETINEKLNARIVSKVGDHILTSNNKIIKLKDIKSIKTLN